MTNEPDKRDAFTLIELLVVLAIISLLSSVVLASLSGARESARDAKRQQDMRQFEIAAELYFQKHGDYPGETYCDESIGSASDSTNCPVSPPEDGWDPSSGIHDLVDEGFMSSLPVDPINDATYHYRYEPSNGDPDFCVSANLEAGGKVYAHAGDGNSGNC